MKNGLKLLEFNYKEGKFHGLQVEFYENGQKFRERRYRNNWVEDYSKSSGTGKVSQLVMMGLDLRKGEDANLNPNYSIKTRVENANLNPNYSIKNEPRAPVRL